MDLGIHKEAEPESFTREELPTYFGSTVSVVRLVKSMSSLTNATDSGPVLRHELAWRCDSLQVYWMEPEEGLTRDAGQYQAGNRGNPETAAEAVISGVTSHLPIVP